MSERSASTFRKGQFTESHILALRILSEHGVKYLAEQVVPIFGEFDGQGRPVAYKVDILINDARYGTGVIEIDGDIHKKLTHERKDARRDARLKDMVSWVEHVPNAEAKAVMSYLEKHRRKVDQYGGVY